MREFTWLVAIVLPILLGLPRPGAASLPGEPEAQRYGVWNLALNQTNVIECSNFGSTPAAIKLNIRSDKGQALTSFQLTLPAHGTTHRMLPQTLGSLFGLYIIEVKPLHKDFVRCHTMFYRQSVPSSDNQMDYAFSIPMLEPTYEPSTGIYNSMNPEAIDAPVQNWLSLINPGVSAWSGRIEIYDHHEGLLSAETITINRLEPGRRRDFPLGHQWGQKVGFYRIIPNDLTKPYTAYVARYSSQNPDKFNFAFVLSPKHADCDSGLLPASTMGPATNWAEIANVSSFQRNVKFDVFQQSGELVHTEQLKLKPNSQRHLHLNDYLGPNNIGFFRVRCSTTIQKQSLIVQSLFYGRDNFDPRKVTWAYASQQRARPSAPVKLIFPLNTHLNAANWLKFATTATSAAEITYSAYNAQGLALVKAAKTARFRRSLDLAAHEITGYDFIGQIEALHNPNAYPLEAIRVFSNEAGEISYITNIQPTYLTQPDSDAFCPAGCGNGVCDEWETAASCPLDCQGRYHVVDANNTDCISSGQSSLATPYCRLRHAALAVTPGDTVYLRAGLQPIDGYFTFNQSGEPGNFITYRNYPCEEPIIESGIAFETSWTKVAQYSNPSFVIWKSSRNFEFGTDFLGLVFNLDIPLSKLFSYPDLLSIHQILPEAATSDSFYVDCASGELFLRLAKVGRDPNHEKLYEIAGNRLVTRASYLKFIGLTLQHGSDGIKFSTLVDPVQNGPDYLKASQHIHLKHNTIRSVRMGIGDHSIHETLDNYHRFEDNYFENIGQDVIMHDSTGPYWNAKCADDLLPQAEYKINGWDHALYGSSTGVHFQRNRVRMGNLGRSALGVTRNSIYIDNFLEDGFAYGGRDGDNVVFVDNIVINHRGPALSFLRINDNNVIRDNFLVASTSQQHLSAVVLGRYDSTDPSSYTYDPKVVFENNFVLNLASSQDNFYCFTAHNIANWTKTEIDHNVYLGCGRFAAFPTAFWRFDPDRNFQDWQAALSPVDANSLRRTRVHNSDVVRKHLQLYLQAKTEEELVTTLFD